MQLLWILREKITWRWLFPAGRRSKSCSILIETTGTASILWICSFQFIIVPSEKTAPRPLSSEQRLLTVIKTGLASNGWGKKKIKPSIYCCICRMVSPQYFISGDHFYFCGSGVGACYWTKRRHFTKKKDADQARTSKTSHWRWWTIEKTTVELST